jgi:hypothetical protein
VEVRDIEQVTSDVVDPIVDAYLAAGRAEASLAGERYTTLVLATGADIAGITGIRIAAGYKALNDLLDVGALIERDFGFKAQIAPAITGIAKDLSKAVVGSGMVGLLPRK